MVESERRRLISSTPHVTPEQVGQQSFSTSFRGYSETEVRAFLKRVADELIATRERETELLDAIDTLEEQLRSPRPLDESQLLDALGAETSRLLRSAREAADEIRTRAEEQAAQAAEAAAAELQSRRGEADEYFQSRTGEAEERATAIVAEAEQNAAEIRAGVDAFSTEQRERAEREANEAIEAARRQGREMLDEAKATRERVLADLFRRRGLLQAQVDELRGGRDNLLDAYRVVKRTFLEATEALAQVELRAAERAAHPGDDDADVSVALDGETDLASGVTEAAGATDVVGDTEAAVESTPRDDADATDPNLADVDSLFARIRAGQTAAPIETAPSTAVDEMGEAVSATSEEPAEAVAPEPAAEAESEPDPATGTEEEVAPPSAVESWRAQRAAVVDPLLVAVAKRAKRAAQDDQNALLDAVRRHKGRPTAAQVLAPEPDFLAAWVSVTREAIDEAYGAGRVAAGGEASAATDDLAAEVAAVIVLPVRERIASAIDSGEEGDTGGLVERIGARFREWKNQALENALGDALAMAWSRGVYDASPDGTVLQWIPLIEGRCADCDDNGLEPTVKGETFPTGQAHPPAHPGCRCLLAPADVLSGLAAHA
jgi:DivIVA domain-containing protein